MGVYLTFYWENLISYTVAQAGSRLRPWVTNHLIEPKNFGAKIRDVCSQIEIAAKCIEQDIKDSPNDPACLRGLYDQIINYDGDLPYRLFFREQIGSFDSFRDRFKNKRRVYVVGIINNENITRENIGHYSSKIARYELVSTWNNFKKNYGDSSLKICFIHPNS